MLFSFSPLFSSVFLTLFKIASIYTHLLTAATAICTQVGLSLTYNPPPLLCLQYPPLSVPLFSHIFMNLVWPPRDLGLPTGLIHSGRLSLTILCIFSAFFLRMWLAHLTGLPVNTPTIYCSPNSSLISPLFFLLQKPSSGVGPYIFWNILSTYS